VETANEFHSTIPSVVSFKVGHATNGPAKNRGFNFAMVIELEDEEVSFDNIVISCPGRVNTLRKGLAQLHWAMRQAEADGQFVIPGASSRSELCDGRIVVDSIAWYPRSDRQRLPLLDEIRHLCQTMKCEEARV
jgi:hypothetical protein